MIKGIDCATKLNAITANAVKQAGYAFVGRYLVPNSGNLSWKALTKEEAKIINDAGLRLLTVWETTADRVKGGAIAGAADGTNALKCARDINMPTTGIIYFAVDYDAQPNEMATIEAYLRAARDNTCDYEIGVYGSYRVIEEMAARNACKAFWQCVAWSYGNKSNHLNIYQGWFGQKVAGVNVDINECSDMDKAGIWSYKEADIMKRYNTIDEIPKWAKSTMVRLVQRGIINGRDDKKDEHGLPASLDLSEDMIRMLIILDRANVF